MARWEPGAKERLVLAAVDLFTEQGFDATTVAQIVERAGVTKSTFFRYFPDKRDVLVAGQAVLSELLAAGVAAAPADAAPLDVVGHALDAVGAAMTPFNRELGPRISAAVAASAELQERDALKTVGLASAMSGALRARGVAAPVADLAAEFGVIAFRQGFERWTASHDDTGLAPYTRVALDELRAAAAGLG